MLYEHWLTAWLRHRRSKLCNRAHRRVCACVCVPSVCVCFPSVLAPLYPPSLPGEPAMQHKPVVSHAQRLETAQWQGPPIFIRPPEDEIHEASQVGVTVGYRDTHTHTHTHRRVVQPQTHSASKTKAADGRKRAEEEQNQFWYRVKAPQWSIPDKIEGGDRWTLSSESWTGAETARSKVKPKLSAKKG